MLTIEVKPIELFNQETQTFFKVGPEKPKKLHLEHSLISISKWESKFKKPFLDDKVQKTKDELKYYVSCMSLDGELDDNTLSGLTDQQYIDILHYIEDNKTASVVRDRRKGKGGKSEILTSELIYYYMAAFHLPFYAEKWHLSRLLMLIRIASAKESNETMKKDDILKENSKINAMRRKAMHTRG